MVAPSPRYTARFTLTAHRYTPTSEERNEAKASLDQLKSLLPADITPEDDIDIVYFVGNLAVPGLLNANDDGVTVTDGLTLARGFERRQCNIEHNRKQIVGYILKTGFSEFGSNRLITEDEARAAGVPFNIVIVAAVWKVANKDLAAFIEEMGAPGSPDKDALSLSFEVGFSDYDIVVLPVGVVDLSKAVKVVKAPIDANVYATRAEAKRAADDYERYDKLLRVNKGSGTMKGGQRVGRVLAGTLTPLGAGIVTVPAAQVKGIEPITSSPSGGAGDMSADAGNGYSYSSTQFTLSPEDAKAFLDYGAAIPEDHLYEEGNDYGREMSPHVTVLYGINGSSSAGVTEAVSEFTQPTLTFGAVSAFENADKPYDVLKVDVDGGPHLQNMYHVVKAATDNHTEWLDYTPHVTLAYVKKGMAQHYVGDACFAGQMAQCSHLTFLPREGDRTEIPLKPAPDQVYIKATHLMPMIVKANRVKIPAGLAEKAKSLNYPKADVTLSDGRVLKGVTVFSGEELDLDGQLDDMQGVVITDMTPCMPPGIDDASNIHPHVNEEFPTKTPEARVKDDKNEAIKDVLRNMPYTDAMMKQLEAAAKLLRIIEQKSGVLSSTSGFTQESTASLHTMQLQDLKQLEAKLNSATKPEEMKEAFANVTLFVEEIAKAGEQYAKAAEQAKKDKEEAEKTSAALQKDLVEARQIISEIKSAQAAALAESKFNERMQSIAELFDLDDDVRAFVAEEVRACVDDASFDKYLTKAKKVMKGSIKTKNAKSADDGPAASPNDNIVNKGKDAIDTTDAAKKPSKQKKDDDMDDDKDDDDAKAALASAKDHPTDILDIDVIGNTSAKKLSLSEQYQNAFAASVSVGGRKIKDIVATKKS